MANAEDKSAWEKTTSDEQRPNIRPPDQDRRDAATRPDASYIVQAPAGSGKTSVLVARFVKLLTGIEKPEQLLAITFTRKAAAEMRQRVIGVLDETQNGAEDSDTVDRVRGALGEDLALIRQRNEDLGWDLVNNPSRLQIKTIDSFAMSLAGRLPLASGFGQRSSPLEDATLLYEAAVHKLLNRLFEADSSSQEISRSIGRFLQLIDNDVGKARRQLIDMLRRRDQWLDPVSWVAKPENRAEAEAALAAGVQRLVDRVIADVEQMVPPSLKDELHWVIEFAQDEAPQTGPAFWRAASSLCMTQGGTFRKTFNKNQGFPSNRKAEKERALDALEELREQVPEAFFARLAKLPDPQLTERQTEDLFAICKVLAFAVTELSNLMRSQRRTDFTELNLAARRALRSSDGGPTELALALDYRIRHILIDEFQDTSNSQYDLFELLLEGWDGGGRDSSLFVVGDPMQSIYRFRDADVTLFERAKRQGVNQVELGELAFQANFRSTPDLVNWFNRIFPEIMGEQADSATGSVGYSPSIAAKGEDANGKHGVRVRMFANHAQEVDGLVKRIKDIRSRRPNDSIAVLVRSRNHLPELLSALRTAKVEWRATDIDPLAEVPAVTDLLSLASALADPTDTLAWLSVMRAPWVGLDLPDLEHAAVLKFFGIKQLQELADDYLTAAGAHRLSRLIDALRRWLPQRHERPPRTSLESVWLECGGAVAYGYNSRQSGELLLSDKTSSGDGADPREAGLGSDESAIDHAERLFELVDRLGPDGWDATLLRRDAERLFAADNADQKLEVLTIHKAKGLQWDHVLLPRLDGTTRNETASLLRFRVPNGGTAGTDFLMAVKESGDLYDWLGEEDRVREHNERLRLLYVACTRAKRSLLLTGVQGKLRSDSLLALLLPALTAEPGETDGEQFADHATAPPEGDFQDQESAGTARPLRRLAENFTWVPPKPDPLRLPKGVDETPVSAPDTAASKREVILGELIHEWLRRLGEDPLPEDADAWLHAQRNEWEHTLAEAGLAEEDTGTCVKEASRQLRAVLNDETGRWLLGPRQGAACEYGISGLIEGDLVSVRLDRTFEHEGERWIIDYKTGLADTDDSSTDALAARHGPQLARYRTLCESLFDKPIRTALYLTALPKFIEV